MNITSVSLFSHKQGVKFGSSTVSQNLLKYSDFNHLNNDIVSFSSKRKKKKIKKDDTYIPQNHPLENRKNKYDYCKTGWIIIPSKKHDENNYEKNSDKLRGLSHNKWKIIGDNGDLCLSEGDFHIYLEEGYPKLGLRFADDEVQEAFNEKGRSKLLYKHFDIFKKHIGEYKLSDKIREEVEELEDKKEYIDIVENKLKVQNVNFETCSTKQLFDAIGIKNEMDEDGKLIIDEFRQPAGFKFSDVDINENDLFGDIRCINSDVDFKDIDITDLGALEEINGDVSFDGSKITSLGKLKTVGGRINFKNSEITSFENLEYVGGSIFIRNAKITSLGKLKTVEGSIYLSSSNLKEEDFKDVDVKGNIF